MVSLQNFNHKPVSSVDMNEFLMCDSSQCLLEYVAILVEVFFLKVKRL